MSRNWSGVVRCSVVALIWLLFPAGVNCFGEEQTASNTAKESVPAGIDELLLFFPARYPKGNWNPPNLAFQDVWIEAGDATRIHGWYCPSENARAIVLIAHGNAGNVAMRAPWLEILQKRLRVTTLMFDYRGYGRSAGRPSVEGALRDARAARARLAELSGSKTSDIVLMGESLGGAITVQLAAESAPRAMILQSTFPSLRQVADLHYPKLSWLVPKAKLHSAAQIGRVHCPLLQSHGTEDTLIPLTQAESLFRLANEPKVFYPIRGADHNDWLTDDYVRHLDHFLDGLRN